VIRDLAIIINKIMLITIIRMEMNGIWLNRLIYSHLIVNCLCQIFIKGEVKEGPCPSFARRRYSTFRRCGASAAYIADELLQIIGCYQYIGPDPLSRNGFTIGNSIIS